MSKKYLLNSFCVILLGLFLGYSTSYLFDKSEIVLENIHLTQHKRSIATIKTTGFTDATTSEMASYKPMFKMNSQALIYDFVEVRIKLENIAPTDNDISTLKVIFTAKKDLPQNLKYQWHLSESQHTNDPITATLSTLKLGESKEIFFNLMGFSKEKQSHVHLTVTSQFEGRPAQRSYAAASRPEDSFEYTIQQINQLEKEALAQAEKENHQSKGTVGSNQASDQKTFLEKKFKRSEIIK